MDARIVLSILVTLRRFRKRKRWTRRRLEAYQAEALGRLREYAYARSPFYQRFHRGLTDQPLSKLPILTKATMMEHFDEFATDREIHLEDVRAHMAGPQADTRYLNRYWINATSGSSGHPGIFLFNRAEWTNIVASFARAQEWAGAGISLTHRPRIAVVASTTPWHMSAQVSATISGSWSPTLRIAASEPLDVIVQRLNAWQPETLISYASMAGLLADEQLQGRLRIAPRLMFTSSEVLTAETRKRVENAWGNVLFDQYGATEGGSFGAECSHHHGLHLFDDLTIFEVVDRDYRPVPPGVYGDKLLITVLFSRTQPLIRYELGDSLRLALEPCPCGSPFMLIDDIQGRTEEILRFASSSGTEIAIHPLVFHKIMDSMPSTAWQIVRKRDELAILLSGASPAIDVPLMDRLRVVLTDQGIVVPTLVVQHVSEMPRTANGKAPLIRSEQ
jgi:putative adenylate-forming enzyme